MIMKTLLAILSVLATCRACPVGDVSISILEPIGIRFAYPANSGVTKVGFHYQINEQLTGVNPGQYNDDVTKAADGYFAHENTEVTVNEGDTVYYWVNVIEDGIGCLLTDQVYKTEIESGVVIDACSSYPCDSSCDTSVAPCNGLIFEETWDTFDMSRWQHEITMSGGGNWEFEYYTNNRSNSYVRDNTLFIKPTLTSDKYGEPFLSSGTLDLWGGAPADLCTNNAFYGCSRTGNGNNIINPIQSARIRTVNSFSFTYGRIEVEAKMPTGDWLWPAIWMLPRYNAYGGWPASGEIDIVESRGNENLKDSSGDSKGNDNMGMTLHWGPFWPLNGYEKTTVEAHPNTGSFASDFHKYTVLWREDEIVFQLDDEVLKTIKPSNGFWEFGEFDTNAPGLDNPWQYSSSKMAPFDQEFYLLLNVAVGGTNGFFQDSWTNTPYAKPWSNTSPTAFKDFWDAKDQWYPTWDGENSAMQVKSIRIYKE